MNRDELLSWLVSGDVSLQYQVHRDLLGELRPDLQARIETEGWGARLLELRRPDGHWGRAYYQPKWTSTHYTLCDLRRLEMPPSQPEVRESVVIALSGPVDHALSSRRNTLRAMRVLQRFE